MPLRSGLKRVLRKQTHEVGPPSPERLRLVPSLEIRERAGTAESWGFLEELSQGAPGVGLTRLDRFRRRQLEKWRDRRVFRGACEMATWPVARGGVTRHKVLPPNPDTGFAA